ncbi:helix-turn-helix transcriptional regulator [Paenibacillus sp. GCM10012306]|uniref:helix-turn-helix transcriptional regulator n=1 Tax=Paenibacillus sp. GCM10012306 TaxID=3317342 RepID=UPI003617B1B0
MLFKGCIFYAGEVQYSFIKEARTELKLSQAQLAEMVGVSRNTISSIETGQFNPTAKLALILCIALDKKFEDLFYF